MNAHAVNTNATVTPDFLEILEKQFENSNKDFARAYYLFATAKLSDDYNSKEIYERYPDLSDEKTFNQLKLAYDASLKSEQGNSSDTEMVSRLFTDVMGTYIAAKFSAQTDDFQNKKNKLSIDVKGLGLVDKEERPLDSILYEDASEYLKKNADKATREALYQKISLAYNTVLTPLFMSLFHAENQLMSDLGYADLISFYSKTSGHNLPQLAQNAKQLVEETEAQYQKEMSALYNSITGLNFKKDATRADIAYVLHCATNQYASINNYFTESQMLPLATKTFDGLGLRFSTVAEIADFKTIEQFNAEVVAKTDSVAGASRQRILLDMANREGKRSRAYVYPAFVPSEIYLSVKPEGGLDDYSAFFHESGHALHFAYTNPELPFYKTLMGNKTTTETYAYLMQNLLMNHHWLVNMAGLSSKEASECVKQRALTDLYMMRRYASKMQFELALYTGVNTEGYTVEGKGDIYAELLTEGCGFRYDAESWTRDVDAGFYVADYFTAWTLEAQLREYLCKHYGQPELNGEDWYQNVKAGDFLKSLWNEGNICQNELSEKLGYCNAVDVTPLLRLMKQCFGRL